MPHHIPEPPKLDEALVQRLADIAAKLDGGDKHICGPLLEEFNRLARTTIPFSEFQGIYGAEEHEDYVRRVLTEKLTSANATLTRNELVEMFRRVCDDPSDDAYLQFLLSTVEKTYGDPNVSDLIFWPGEYFGDGNNSRGLTPEEMADAVLDRYRRKQNPVR